MAGQTNHDATQFTLEAQPSRLGTTASNLQSPADSAAILGLAAYIDWQPLTGQGLDHCYRALRASDRQTVEILFFPAIQSGQIKPEQVKQQLSLFGSVLPALASVDAVLLGGPNPYVVRTIGDEMPWHSFISSAPTPIVLSLIARFLQLVNETTRRRLYHGHIRENTLAVRPGTVALPGLNFLHRYCLAELDQLNVSTSELYQRDLKDTLELCGRIVAQQLNLLDNQLATSEPGLRLEPRQLAILRKLCHERLSAIELDETFERWLDFFDEFRLASAVGESQSTPSGDGTQLLEAMPGLPEEDSQNTSVLDVAMPRALAPVASLLQPGKTFGRYTIAELLGRGGMGAVYRGIDSTTGQPVAIKVLRVEGSNSPQAVRRFHKEARLLASLQNDHVTQLVEVGEIDSIPFIAMEFVNGIDLKRWLRGRQPLDEGQGLRVVRDIASALVEAHQRGIIHRDIKPENVMLASAFDLPKDQLAQQLQLDGCLIKLTDFGIAREIHQSQSMDVTRAGGILGTPHYMSPEQVKGSDQVGTPTDIYALGVTLYELLAGSVPYDDVDFIKIAAKHCFEAIPDVRRRNTKVSEATSVLISRMLAKQAAERPADAAALIREIDAILDGAPNDFALHPVVPDFGATNIWSRDFQWTLRSTPAELWPHVSNTERLNRAMGLAAVDYRVQVDPKLGVRRFGAFKIGGIKVEWEEHPFEWVEGVRFGVLREFVSGPFKWFLSKVEFQPLPGGGTRLTHSVRVEPRNTLGRVISEVEAGWKGGRSLDRIYRRIDESIQQEKQGQSVWDRFAKEQDLPGHKRERLEARVDRMIQLGANLEDAQKLADYVRRAPAQELSKIRPGRLAEQLKLSSAAMLDACLVAAASGILTIQWDIICPTCRVAAANEHILTSIKKHAHCEACDAQFQTSVAQAIELTFQVHPEIRTAHTGRYCIGGPWHAPHVVTQVRLMPGERMALPVSLESGDYLLRTVGQLDLVSIAARPSNHLANPTFDIDLQSPETTAPRQVAAGQLTITLVNHAAVPRTVRLERTVERELVITAAAACSLPRFRQLFPEQRFHEDVPVSSEELSLLVVQLHELDSLYASAGDQAAYELVVQWLRAAQAQIQRAGGSVVRHIDGGLIGVFIDCEPATQAALALLEEYRQVVSDSQPPIGLGLHRGRTLIAQQDGLNDYFGSTLRVALGLAALSSNALATTDTIIHDPAVRKLLQQAQLKTQTEAERVAGAPWLVHKITHP